MRPQSPPPPPPPLIRGVKPSIPPFPPLITAPKSNQPAHPISDMAGDFTLAFDHLKKDCSDIEPLVDASRSHYAISYIPPLHISTLQQRLNTPSKNHAPLPFSHSLLREDLSRLLSDQFIVLDTLKPMCAGFIKELNSIDLSQKVSAVFFIAAVIICTAASAIATANANPEWAWAAVAGAATAAPVASTLFGALGKWRHSVLSKSETAVKKQKDIATCMISAANCAIKDLITIDHVASRLEFETNSLSETPDDEKKVAAVKRSSEELLQIVKNYNGEIKLVKQKVVDIIIKT